MLAEAVSGLLAAIQFAAHGALFGCLAFLAVVATPLTLRLPDEQSRALTARTRCAVRLFALVTVAYALAEGALLAFLFNVLPPLATVGMGVAGLVVFFAVPRGGPAPLRVAALTLLVAVAMILSFAREGAPWFGQRELAALLAEAGLGLTLGSLPALWLALRAPWPASVSQVVGVRHLGLALPGLALLLVAGSIAWPQRAILCTAEIYPVAVLAAVLAAVLLLAFLARAAFLAMGSRAGAAPGWLPRLIVTMELEMLLGLALSAAAISLVMAQPGTGPTPSLLPTASLRAPGPMAAVGGLVILMALLSAVQWPRWRRFTRFGPILLLPIAFLLMLQPQGGLRDGLAILVLIAGVGETWRLLGGERGRLERAPAILALLGIMLMLAAPPLPTEALPILLVLLAMIARWKELRLPSDWERHAASIGYAACLGVLGLLLIVTHGG
nr:hypothetical protein [uncultured Roseococcus sp.]